MQECTEPEPLVEQRRQSNMTQNNILVPEVLSHRRGHIRSSAAAAAQEDVTCTQEEEYPEYGTVVLHITSLTKEEPLKYRWTDKKTGPAKQGSLTVRVGISDFVLLEDSSGESSTDAAYRRPLT